MNRSKIVLGLWPIAGVTTIGVTPEDAEQTIAAAIEGGITAFDTAYSYGFEGESDRLLGSFIGSNRERYRVMGKVGQRWSLDRQRVVDGSKQQLLKDAEESLRRMKLDYFDVLFLHAPDPNIALEESAAAMEQMRHQGWCRKIGICNITAEQLHAFSRHAQVDAIQCPLNLVQRETQQTLIAPATELGCDVYAFWALMKGLLAGKIGRDHVFQAGDSRPKYPIFQGRLRESIHDAIDRLSQLGKTVDQTVAQMAVGWVISQPGVTAALVGARRPDQIQETLSARVLSEAEINQVDAIIGDCIDLRNELN